MRDPDEFDAFYRDAGERLLLQTYALTGDLTAARSAVRDSFIVAWHHWRKISRLDDPESFVRPRAWRHAQRRHTARLWHRDQEIGPETRATLDALATLSLPQRRVLLLSQLATISRADLAREVGMTLDEAERELQAGASQFALARDVSAAEIPLHLEALSQVVAQVRFPRAPIVRRAGSARRRTHTTLGVVAAVAAFLVSGSLVTDTTGVRPTLDFAGGSASAGQPSATPTPEAPEPRLTEDTLLTPAQLTASDPGRAWTVRRTTDNSSGSGLHSRCQQERYADPRGTAALVRVLEAVPAKRRPASSLVQLSEASASERAARRAFGIALSWYAGCSGTRVQLVSTRRVEGVGDQAVLVVLRSWAEPVDTSTVAIARTGRLLTTTVAMTDGVEAPAPRRTADLLGTAVNGLCALPDGGGCAGKPVLVSVPPPAVGPSPALLVELDLPPVRGVAEPWVGTAARKAVTNVASTRCDTSSFRGSFEGAKFRHSQTRTFLVPEARLPDEFGLTETVGALPRRAAKAFVEQVRRRLASCPDRDLGTEVTLVAQERTGRTDISVWQLRTEISDQSSLSYSMAIIRNGTAVAQLQFVPSGDARMRDGAFADVVRRAVERLGRLPRP